MASEEPRIEAEEPEAEVEVDESGERESAEDRAAALEDQLKRVAADFDNYRKRVAREREEFAVSANERLVKELIPVLDDLERALEAAARPRTRRSSRRVTTR